MFQMASHTDYTIRELLFLTVQFVFAKFMCGSCFRVKFRENLNNKNNWFWMTLVYTERLEKRKAPLEISIGIYVWTDGSVKVISNGLCELLNNVDREV